MMDTRYPVNLKTFFICFSTWSAWMAVWILVPAGELVWGPIQYVIILLFSPIGMILLASLAGYRIRVAGSRLTIGFFPFTRSVRIGDIRDISRTSSYYLNLWHTNEFITLVQKNGRAITFPCCDADHIIGTIRALR